MAWVVGRMSVPTHHITHAMLLTRFRLAPPDKRHAHLSAPTRCCAHCRFTKTSPPPPSESNHQPCRVNARSQPRSSRLLFSLHMPQRSTPPVLVREQPLPVVNRCDFHPLYRNQQSRDPSHSPTRRQQRMSLGRKRRRRQNQDMKKSQGLGDIGS